MRDITCALRPTAGLLACTRVGAAALAAPNRIHALHMLLRRGEERHGGAVRRRPLRARAGVLFVGGAGLLALTMHAISVGARFIVNWVRIL
jgi:hypothetical protein